MQKHPFCIQPVKFQDISRLVKKSKRRSPTAKKANQIRGLCVFCGEFCRVLLTLHLAASSAAKNGVGDGA